MLYSIIIPVYKVEKYLDQCVKSILNQSYQDFEMILVDDGSPDRCPDMCEAYAKQDSRIRVIHKHNGGLSDARNYGIDSARGEYTLFLDSDDYYDDRKALEKISKRLEQRKADVINFAYKKIYKNEDCKIGCFESAANMPLQYEDKTAQLKYLFENQIYIASACNKVVKTSLIKNGLYFQKGDTSEDVEWCAGLLEKADSLDFVNECFYCYRQRDESITHTVKKKNCDDLARHILKCLDLAEQCNKETRFFLYQFAVYQLAVFVITQSMAESIPQESIYKLSQVDWLFQYSGKNKKVQIVAGINKIMGYEKMCALVRLFKRLRKKI